MPKSEHPLLLLMYEESVFDADSGGDAADSYQGESDDYQGFDDSYQGGE